MEGKAGCGTGGVCPVETVPPGLTTAACLAHCCRLILLYPGKAGTRTRVKEALAEFPAAGRRGEGPWAVLSLPRLLSRAAFLLSLLPPRSLVNQTSVSWAGAGGGGPGSVEDAENPTCDQPGGQARPEHLWPRAVGQNQPGPGATGRSSRGST